MDVVKDKVEERRGINIGSEAGSNANKSRYQKDKFLEQREQVWESSSRNSMWLLNISNYDNLKGKLKLWQGLHYH